MTTAAAPALTHTEIIARLNDRCRMGLARSARTVITRTCLAVLDKGGPTGAIVAQANLLAAIR